MARREAILPEELFETANRLKAEGKKVSADSLMEALGGGSYRTIYKLMGQWEQMQPTATTTSPNEIPAAVQASFASAWRLAAQEAERGLLTAKEKAAEEVGAALQQVEGALEQIGKLEAESEADAIRIEELTAKLAEKEELAHQAQTEAAAHKATAEQLQKLVEKQEKDLERLRNESIQEREKHQEAQQNTNATIEILKESLKNAQANAEKFERESRENRNLRDQMNQAKEKAEEASKADRAERDTALKETAELKGEVKTLVRQNEQLVARLAGSDKDEKRKP
ncbi:MAG: hypothetical protein C0473_02250 [Cyanobacteria bacterium DS3.002]|nr:hypothetical protein [Cyanobacteria bacterium DS3.002]MBA4049634.1 hypothetical protein [Cyanobacteria bacterium DS2.008]MBA4073401.1 hypothetical protein [Cyanobacteria bacterium PR.023]